MGGGEQQTGAMLLPKRTLTVVCRVVVFQYYLKTGTCKFGATCKYHHPREKAGSTGRVHLNVLGLPLRQVGSPKPAWEWVLAGRAMQHSLVGMLCLYALGVLE